MKVKVSELTAPAPALDWAVAEANGTPIYRDGKTLSRTDIDGVVYWQPTTDWAQGGPIIEKEKISLEIKDDGWWVASRQYNYSETKEYIQLDHSPLIAAMRCYVASKLGDEVEVPEELL